jgi:hypothetical protein
MGVILVPVALTIDVDPGSHYFLDVIGSHTQMLSHVLHDLFHCAKQWNQWLGALWIVVTLPATLIGIDATRSLFHFFITEVNDGLVV